MRGTLRSVAAAGAFALIGLPLHAQQRQTDASFKWSGRVAAGRTLHIDNVNGSIYVGAASGDNVEVTATKQWRRGDPSLVRILTSASGDGGMTVCALWDDRNSCEDRPTPRRYRDGNSPNGRENRNNDVSVEFRVLLPRGVKLAAGTVNGSVTVDGATTDVSAETVNGDLDLTNVGGRLNAQTVNGAIRARLTRIESEGAMQFETVNGNIMLELPQDFGGDLDLESVMGSLNSSFEMTLRGRMDPHHLRTHIGKPGGPRIHVETVHGTVDIRKR